MPAILLLALVAMFIGWPLIPGGHIAFYISQSLLVAFLLWREAARGSFAMRAVCLFGVAIEVVEALRWAYFYVFSPRTVPDVSQTAWCFLVVLILYAITNKNGSN